MDVACDKLIANLKGHKRWVFSAAFSPDGKKVVTASFDSIAKIRLTPEGIIDWLKTAPLYKLTQQDLAKLGIDFIDLKKVQQ
jgi:WD40 repeat protein